jgi:LIM homeobox transcription factor 1
MEARAAQLLVVEQQQQQPTTITTSLTSKKKQEQQQAMLKTETKSPICNGMMGGSGAICASCHQAIDDKFIYTLMDTYWHERCLQCSECGTLLKETCFYKNKQLYCKSDYFK